MRDGKEMKCKRCGANEDRIHGFCSIECRDQFYLEEDIAELTTRIAELEEERRWIPVSERLPELDQDVFAVVEGEIVKGHFYQDFDGVTHFSTDDDALLVATHWFPMPQLPEEREI
jgi:NMD protein affecting ribosome stability and mRNA decay